MNRPDAYVLEHRVEACIGVGGRYSEAGMAPGGMCIYAGMAPMYCAWNLVWETSVRKMVEVYMCGK